MRRLIIWLIAMLPLFTGCLHGDPVIPCVCSAELPGTQYSIWLHGPDLGGGEYGYFYTIETPDGNCGRRKLGDVTIDGSIPPRLDDLDNGVFRVTWGDSPNAAFTTIDTKQRLIVNDSSESNTENVPFETPCYLRPDRWTGQIQLAGTQYSVYLYGPEYGYYYRILTPDGQVGSRELGDVTIDESIPPQLDDLGNGVFRVTWAKYPTAAFTTIDTKQKLIVDDSNESNPKNIPFETPSYLRPE